MEHNIPHGDKEPFDIVALSVGVGILFVVAWTKKLLTGQGVTLIEAALAYLVGVGITKFVRGMKTS